MKPKSIIFFAIAVGISCIAATYRFSDSAHSIGLIKAKGGEARHASVFESGKDEYTLISTATVIPPYRGDVQVTLEGEPKIDYRIYFSGPVINLGIRRLPEFRNGVIHGLQPRDRIALWVVMHPPAVDPVCGMVYTDGFRQYMYRKKGYFFCSERCMDTFAQEPEKYKDSAGLKGSYTLAFNDVSTGASVLKVPVIFKGKGDSKDAGGHHH